LKIEKIYYEYNKYKVTAYSNM